MAHPYIPPPEPTSVEEMLRQFSEWMAEHMRAKITVRIDYKDGTQHTSVIDRTQFPPNKE